VQSRFAPIWLLAAVVLASVPLHAAEEAEYTIETGTNEVQISFTAADRQGHAIQTLHPPDVAVVDNGWIIRQFRSFRRASEEPLNLVVLIDASGSMESEIRNEIVEVKNFVAAMATAEQDRVAIFSIGGVEPRLICDRNCNGEAAAVQLSALRANGMTPLYDAIVQASQTLKDDSDPQSRSAMILFSDGNDTISMHSFQDALQAAQDLQTAIYAVNSGRTPSEGNSVLDSLAVNTGGLNFRLGKNVASVLQMILDDLRSGYVLTYELQERSIGEHTVQLLPTSDPNLQFRSRHGYNDRGKTN
jgi:VWFA-related protein